MQELETYKAKYVYCIISGDESRVLCREGLGGQACPGRSRGDNQVYTIPYRDISAVVSDVPLEPLEPTTEHVLAHEGVIEEVMAGHTVLPLRFGIVFASEARVRDILEENYRLYKENLARLQDKVELGLKVLWGEKEIRREVARTSERVTRFREEMAGRAREFKRVRGTPGMRGKGYYLQMKLEKDVAQLEQLMQEEMGAAREREALHIFKNLREQAIDSCLNRLLDQSMILNAAFLVSRGKGESFSQRAETLKSANAERGMEFAPSGPWPPYNFVYLENERR